MFEGRPKIRIAQEGKSMGQEHRYRGFTIYWNPKPIPDRRHDYSWVHDEYDGAPDEPGGGCLDRRAGHSAGLQEAKADIDELLEDLEQEQ